MSEKIFKFLLSELQVIRLRCLHENCGAVTEMSVDLMSRTPLSWECPVCHRSFLRPTDGGDHPLLLLVRGLRGVAASNRLVEVEFVIPDKG